MGRFGDVRRGLLWVGLLAVVLSGGVRNARADFTFGKAQSLGPAFNSSSGDASISVSADGLELYFGSDRPGGLGGFDLWVCTRHSINEPWGPPANVGAPVNSGYSEIYPSLSTDGLTLYFSDLYSGTPRPGGLGGAELWITTRASRSDPWVTPVSLGAPINSSAGEISPSVSGDGLTLVFASSRAGTGGPYDLWISTREDVQDSWGTPVNLGANVNSSSYGELECSLSTDGLALFFVSGRPGGLSNYDLWMTTRKSLQDPWERTVNVGSIVNSTADDGSAGISPDMRTLYFCSNRPGGLGSYDLFEAPIIPIVDFNGDGIVAIEDLVRLIESWSTDDPTTDIGPGPWGDGKVDERDLEVLMSYWGQEVIDPALVARWKLDETEGNVAQNSVSDNHGTLHGEPLWQPSGGKKAGALQFDGIDDYVSTDFVLNPADGLFSVFAWIQGGMPGQVIISQTNGSNGTGETWLGADTMEGKLMTGLQAPGQRGPNPPMISNAVITDGQWHHVGLVVWENKARELYADGMKVAFDTQPVKISSSDGGLYFGADKALDAATFFSGLIDDVRIYNVALTADKIAALAN